MEDQKGFIWIGTREGLSRFDGAEFKNFYFSDASNAIGNYYTSFFKIAPDKIMMLNNSKLAVLNTSTNSLQLIEKFKNYTISTITDIGDSMYVLHIKNYILVINKKFDIIGSIQFDKVKTAYLTTRKISKGKILICNFYDFYVYDVTTKGHLRFRLILNNFTIRLSIPFGSNSLMKLNNSFTSPIFLADYMSLISTDNWLPNTVRMTPKNTSFHPTF